MPENEGWGHPKKQKHAGTYRIAEEYFGLGAALY
jgi:hypothetical protein